MVAVQALRRPAASSASGIGNLSFGSRGRDVLAMQRQLKASGYDPGPLDGIFGPRTLAAVKGYQSSRRLQVDGIVGPKTRGALNGNAPAQSGGAGRAGDSFNPGSGKPVNAYINGRPMSINVQSVGNGQFMRADAANGFVRMQADARRAGINLSATSGFRTMAQQQHLYNLYKAGRGNLAAKPGYSNHQGGISMDIGGIGGYGTTAYKWLQANARKYGFVNDVGGEPWHWTFRG